MGYGYKNPVFAAVICSLLLFSFYNDAYGGEVVETYTSTSYTYSTVRVATTTFSVKSVIKDVTLDNTQFMFMSAAERLLLGDPEFPPGMYSKYRLMEPGYVKILIITSDPIKVSFREGAHLREIGEGTRIEYICYSERGEHTLFLSGLKDFMRIEILIVEGDYSETATAISTLTYEVLKTVYSTKTIEEVTSLESTVISSSIPLQASQVYSYHQYAPYGTVVAVAVAAVLLAYMVRGRLLKPSQKPSESFKYCLECGARLKAEAKYCDECGTKQ